ncbi:MAG: 30S ribosomal protein S16 [Flammeovirgaceae bacterium]
MAVKIRLARHGRKKKAVYSIVVADARAPRDGRFIEKLGTFNPNVHPAHIELHEDRALHWVMTGAQPTETTRSILSTAGVMLRKHLQVGVLKGAISQETADQRYEAWRKDKEAKLGQSLFVSKDNPVEVEAAAPVVEEVVVAPTPVVEETVEETPAVAEKKEEEVVAETTPEEVKEETTEEAAPKAEVEEVKEEEAGEEEKKEESPEA